MDTKLNITITLLSDAIFSSGYSVPGGDDIDVYKNDAGLPYFKATSFKGLLRGSMENLAFCKGEDLTLVDDLFGMESLDIHAERMRFTDFSLIGTVPYENIFSKRAFTAVEDGTAKDGSLRTAEVINKGLQFSGDIYCNAKDIKQITQGIQGIKWIGLLKNRGFGNVSISIKDAVFKNTSDLGNKIGNAKMLYFKLKTLSPVVITDLTTSNGNHQRCKNYITGASIRGLVLNYIAKHNPTFFEENKIDLLESKFFNANLCMENQIAIPTIKGFYEHKDGSGLETIMKKGEFETGKKRAGLGNVCAFESGATEILHKKTKLRSVTRIKTEHNEDNLIFSTESIDENQEFDGYIVLKNETFASEIVKAFEQEFWIGADQSQGFGRCCLTDLQAVESVKYVKAYTYQTQADITNELYCVAVSPLTMLDDSLQPCGFNLDELAKKLDISSVSILYASTSTSAYFGFNAKWKAYNTRMTMYDEGSIFKLVCGEVPKLENIMKLQNDGLGVRQEDGFGQVLFIRNDIIHSIEKKNPSESKEVEPIITAHSKLRKAKIDWIRKNKATVLKMPLSKSQIGEVQAVCESGKIEKVNAFFEKQTDPNSPKRNYQYNDMRDFINQFIEHSLTETLNYEIEDDSIQMKFAILCELFDYSRKGGN